jgi:ABC-type dipeptide/oligopeptide/nickel transport system permease component
VREIFKNIAYTIIIGICLLFFGTFIIFIFLQLLPGDPVAGYLASMGIHNPTDEQYLWAKHQLGLDVPIFLRYFKFLGDLFTGNWKVSLYPEVGRPTFDLVGEKTQDFIFFLIVPLCTGLFFGHILGNISSKKRYSRSDKAIQVFCILGLSLPVFFFGMLIQYFICFKADLCDLSGDYVGAFFPFTFAVLSLITWQLRSYRIKYANERSLIHNTLNTGIIFGFIFLFYILIDITLNLSGFGSLLFGSLYHYNYFVIGAGLFVLLLLLIFTVLISNIIFSIRKFRSGKTNNTDFEPIIRNDLETEEKSIIKIRKEDIKKYILERLKSPIFILAGLCLIFFIFISIFPFVLTNYSLQEARSVLLLSPPWNGAAVLALIIWGIRDALLVGFGAVLFGLVGAVIFGFVIWISKIIKSRIENNIILTLFCILIYLFIIGFVIFLITFPILGIGSFLFSFIIGSIFGVGIGLIYFIRSRNIPSNNSATFLTEVDRVVKGLLIIFYVLPVIILVLLFIFINMLYFSPFGLFDWGIFYYLGIFLIPGFTLAITKGISRQVNLGKLIKSITNYIPLAIAFSLMIYFAIGFIGWWFPSSLKVNLGYMFKMGRSFLTEALGGWIWSGIIMFGIVFSFFLFHIGLQEKEPKW